jgi:hypothetical protein
VKTAGKRVARRQLQIGIAGSVIGISGNGKKHQSVAEEIRIVNEMDKFGTLLESRASFRI